MDKDIELLAPAGSLESVKAAIHAGADAVYTGGSQFGARAYAQNLTQDELISAIDYAHMFQRKLYLTVNTLLKETELEEALYAYIAPLYEAGLDAVIVQDMGVFSYIHKTFPDLHIHCSTQMTLSGAYSASLLEKMGATRVVTPRELSLEEIRKIRESTDVEIESFVHGALCYCYSGQCLLSSIIGGRSGNRGRCAQPCRLPYDVMWDSKVVNDKNHKYVLSPKDMCTIELLPEIIEAGVTSLKIEGRMKKPVYTAGVVSIYRKYLNYYLKYGKKGYRVSQEDKQKLWDLFNRNGFHQSYYKQHNGPNMITFSETKFRPGNDALYQELEQDYVEKPLKRKISVYAYIAVGQPALVTVTSGADSVTVTGQLVEEAKNRPMSSEDIQKPLLKWGNTNFEPEDITVELAGNIFIPVGALNALRRQAEEALTSKIIKPFYRTPSFHNEAVQLEPERCEKEISIICLVNEKAQWESLLDNTDASCIYVESGCQDSSLLQKSHSKHVAVYYVFPDVFRQDARQWYEENWNRFQLSAYDGYVIRSLETLALLPYLQQKPIVFDSNLYAYNQEAVKAYGDLGAARRVLPLELNYRELSKLDTSQGILMVYGRIPVMITANCIRKNLKQCGAKGEITLKDRYKNQFPVKTDCRFCYNKIYNSQPLSLQGMEHDIRKLAPYGIKLDFTTETKNETVAIYQAFSDALQGKRAAYQIENFTRGHFKRGVE